jgi:hypothetical protein
MQERLRTLQGRNQAGELTTQELRELGQHPRIEYVHVTIEGARL